MRYFKHTEAIPPAIFAYNEETTEEKCISCGANYLEDYKLPSGWYPTDDLYFDSVVQVQKQNPYQWEEITEEEAFLEAV